MLETRCLKRSLEIGSKLLEIFGSALAHRFDECHLENQAGRFNRDFVGRFEEAAETVDVT